MHLVPVAPWVLQRAEPGQADPCSSQQGHSTGSALAHQLRAPSKTTLLCPGLNTFLHNKAQGAFSPTGLYAGSLEPSLQSCSPLLSSSRCHGADHCQPARRTGHSGGEKHLPDHLHIPNTLLSWLVLVPAEERPSPAAGHISGSSRLQAQRPFHHVAEHHRKIQPPAAGRSRAL